MDIKVIIANLIGLVSFVISIMAYHKKEKPTMFMNTIISNSLVLIQYILLNAYSGIVTKIIAILRDFVMIKKEKYKHLNSKLILMGFVIIYAILGYLTYQGILSIFSILAALIYTLMCWNGNETKVRQSVIITGFLWLIYNFYVKSYTGCLSNIVMIISTSFAIYKNK